MMYPPSQEAPPSGEQGIRNPGSGRLAAKASPVLQLERHKNNFTQEQLPIARRAHVCTRVARLSIVHGFDPWT